MDKLDRLFKLHEILDTRRYPVPESVLLDELGCGRSTLYRIKSDLETRLGAPVENSPGRGWFYDRLQAFQMPGLWFTAAEIQALAAMRQILADLEPGLLTDRLETMANQVDRLLEQAAVDGQADLARRIHLISHFQRVPASGTFGPVAAALGARKRLHIHYAGRTRNDTTRREISPQRLTRYRDNWYLDAWCHEREALRSFALDRISPIPPLETPAEENDENTLDAHFGRAYGIFAGPAKHLAILRFTPERARWVADETWHPDQASAWLDDGRYELQIPYGDPRELIGDILRHGAHCEVVAPESLRRAVAEEVRKMNVIYG